MRINPEIRKTIDASGLPFRLEEGSRHIKVMLNGQLVTTVSRRSIQGSGRAVKNIVAAIRRAAAPLTPEVTTTAKRRTPMVKLTSVPPAPAAQSTMHQQELCLVAYTRTGQIMVYLPEELVPDKGVGYKLEMWEDNDAKTPTVTMRVLPADRERAPRFRKCDSKGRADGMYCATFSPLISPGADCIDHFGMSNAIAIRMGRIVDVRIERADMRPAVIKGKARRELEAMMAAPALPAPEPALSHTPVTGIPSLQMFKDAVRAVNAYVTSPEGENVRLDISSSGTLRASIAEVIE